MLSICCIFFIIGSCLNCNAQNLKSDITISFVKSNDSIKTTDMYFNVLKVCNTSQKAISGIITFNGPENWKIISFPLTKTVINPGDSISVPVRVSPTADALGGITYIISASFRTKERQLTTNTYLTLPSKPKWEFTTSSTSLYFTKDRPTTTFAVKLSNKGNTNELIKIHIKLGKLLMFNNNNDGDAVEFIDLPAFKDTTILHTVSYQKKLSFTEKLRYENNWKESSILAIASNDKTERSATIMTHKLNSDFYNQRVQNSSPLNIDYQIYNLMSSQQPRSNLKVYGSVLFPENRSLEYVVGLQNINYGRGSNDNFNVDRQLFYTFRYIDKRNNIEVGYNVSGGNLHNINGRGISGSYRINQKNILSYAITQNPFSQSIGESVGFTTSIKRLSLSTGLTHESNSLSKYDATSGLLGIGFSLLRHHSFQIQFLGSQATYKQALRNDTTVLGYSYKIDYTVRYKRFDFKVSGLNSTHNYIRNSGLLQLYLDTKYLVNDRVVLSIYGSHQNYNTTQYPYNFYNPSSSNTSDYARFTTSISSGNISYQFGPNYQGTQRQFFNSITGFKSNYTTFQPGIWGATTFKLYGYKSITPNVTISNLRFNYTTNDPASQSYSFNNNIYYTVGLNFFDTNWRINAYYSSGSSSDLYRSVLIDSTPTVSSSIQFRPYYENFFFDRKVKLSAYLNYAYYMPSGRENTSYNVRYDQFMNHGWTLSFSGFMYQNVINDKTQGRISTKDLNFTVGITKSFNIQQPRLKYYNLKTVFFNDLDGNHIKSDNEPPVSNILVSIEKDRSVSKGKSNIPEIQLLSDVNGSIFVENLPKDNYKLTFNPLTNLENLYFLNGANQSYYNDKEKIMYVPLAESYRVKGKINVVRDPNSTEGKLDLSSIRITATGEKGETYSTLTDNFGGYVINVPNATKYKVHINNVFGEQFNIETNEFEVQFTQNKAINLDFTFIERIREVKFENGNELFKFNSISGESETPVVDSDAEINKKAPEIQPLSYAIQLGAIKSYRDPSYYKNKFKVADEVLYLEKDGLFKYYSGVFSTLKDARSQITKLGFSGLIGVPVDRSLLKHAKPVVVSKPIVQLPVKPTIIPVVKALSYSIQLDALKSYRDPSFYQLKFKLKDEVYYLDKDGEYKYYSGIYSSPEAAKADISRLGLSGFPVAIDPSLLKKAIPVETKKPEVVEPVKTTEVPSGKPLSYFIQLDALKSYRDPSYYKTKYKLTSEVLYMEKDGEFKYYTGIYSSMDIAKSEIQRLHLAGFPMVVDMALLKKGMPVVPDKTVPVKPVGSMPISTSIQPTINSQTYTIQLDALKTFRDPSFYKIKFKLPEDAMWLEKDGVFKYYTGGYPTIEAADADILKYGLSGYVVQVDRKLLKKGNTYKKP